MPPLLRLLVVWGLSAALNPTPAPTQVHDDVRAGYDLSADDAGKLERRLDKKPKDRGARLRLVGYYFRLMRTDPDEAKRGRAHHLLWMVANTPEDETLSQRTAVVGSRGAPSSDPALRRGMDELWRKHLASPKQGAAILSNAAAFYSTEDPAQAFELYSKLSLEDLPYRDRILAGLCARAIAGLNGVESGEPAWFDPDLRDSAFAEECFQSGTTGTNRVFVSELARLYHRTAAPAYASGLLQADYTPRGGALLAHARAADPVNVDLMLVPGEKLPDRGAHVPVVLRIGGVVQKKRLVNGVPPAYPEEARRRGIEGTVKLAVMIALDGSVAFAVPVDGPPELRDSAAQAIRQWKYRPTLLNKKPVYVRTQIDVTYTLSGVQPVLL